MSFARDGYMVAELGEKSRAELNALVSAIEADVISLHEAHQTLPGDILALQGQWREYAAMYCRGILANEQETFGNLLGRPLLAQRKPYLRIARPGLQSDNIGFHKDTWYGGHPAEVTAWIPLVDVDERAALKVAPGSQLREHETEEIAPQVEKGTLGHALGFLYAPKRLKEPVEMVPVPVRRGQMIVLSLGVIHGQECNESTMTRWSMDGRVVCANSDIGEKRLAAYAPL